MPQSRSAMQLSAVSQRPVEKLQLFPVVQSVFWRHCEDGRHSPPKQRLPVPHMASVVHAAPATQRSTLHTLPAEQSCVVWQGRRGTQLPAVHFSSMRHCESPVHCGVGWHAPLTQLLPAGHPAPHATAVHVPLMQALPGTHRKEEVHAVAATQLPWLHALPAGHSWSDWQMLSERQ